MKKFFYLLLLINLAVFLWNFSVNRETEFNRSVDQTHNGKQIERIILDSELAELSAKAKQDNVSVQKPMVSQESSQEVRPAPEKIVMSTGDEKINEDVILSDANGVQSEAMEPGSKNVPKPTPPGEENGEDSMVPTKVTKTEAKGNLPSEYDDSINFIESCFEIGPFSKKNKMHSFAESLRSLANHVDFETRPGEPQVDYWLLYPAADTYESSKANFKMLKARGVDDIWLFRKGNLRGAISLGLFKIKARALKVQKKFKAKNIDVELKSRQVQTKQYWLMSRFDKPTKLTLDSLTGLIRDRTDIQLIQKESCFSTNSRISGIGLYMVPFSS